MYRKRKQRVVKGMEDEYKVKKRKEENVHKENGFNM